MQKIAPCLWFNDNAEEAVKFYTSIFRKSKVGRIARYDKAGEKVSGRPAGSVMSIDFRIEGQDFTALNGGPHFKFNEAVSFVVHCRTQREVDYYWRKLTAGGGKEQQCGWLKDRFGVSWQVVPVALHKLMNSRDPARRQRVMEALLKMVKLDVGKLEKAAEGRK
ncbi:MAG TPA: VOC family protein [Verrucomicrobia bacterium]|nr:VOC family protein [Verrucomicrobiota bacterium]HOB33119.1 VOC family protein [Verrucomicrobiota bacterium]HOP96161.1 VOC family protein [Verrucomicrobiota bacterium]HPU56274.1 VOC family protein [Verrucomicrobiota bacterium]